MAMSWRPSADSPDGRMELMAREAADNPRVLALGGGLPAPDSFPRQALAQAFEKLMSDPELGHQALQYGWPEGHGPLREFITQRLQARGLDVQADEVIVTSGAQQGLALAVTCLENMSPQRRVQVDAATYPGALELFHDRGFEATTDACPIVYALPALSLPQGLRMTNLQRQALLEDTSLTLIEDDAYAELVFDGAVPRPLAADARDRTWYVGTFSKILCPGLRVGWLVPPRGQERAALDAKREFDLQTSGLSQSLTASYLSLQNLDVRLKALRAFYQRRAQALIESVKQHFPAWKFDVPEGGFSLWLMPDAQVDETRLMACALHEGMSFDPGSQFRPDGVVSPLALRLCFSFNNEVDLQTAVTRLARAWHRMQSGAFV